MHRAVECPRGSPRAADELQRPQALAPLRREAVCDRAASGRLLPGGDTQVRVRLPARPPVGVAQVLGSDGRHAHDASAWTAPASGCQCQADPAASARKTAERRRRHAGDLSSPPQYGNFTWLRRSAPRVSASQAWPGTRMSLARRPHNSTSRECEACMKDCAPILSALFGPGATSGVSINSSSISPVLAAESGFFNKKVLRSGNVDKSNSTWPSGSSLPLPKSPRPTGSPM